MAEEKVKRSLGNFKREISEKWAEARQWAGDRTSKTKYRMPKSLRPDGAVAGSTKSLAARYYQLKTGHGRTGQYLHWAKARPTAQRWWCRCPSETRHHHFKVWTEWKMQQMILWAEVLKETKRWKSRWTVRDLLADGRCGQAVLDLLSTTDVGRLAPPLAEGDDARSGKRNGRERRRSWVLRRNWGPGRNCRCFYPHPPSWHRRTRSRGALSFVSLLCNFLGRNFSFLGQAWAESNRGANREFALCI